MLKIIVPHFVFCTIHLMMCMFNDCHVFTKGFKIRSLVALFCYLPVIFICEYIDSSNQNQLTQLNGMSIYPSR